MDEGAEDILLVEDNPGDVRLIEEALDDTPSTLYVVGDGKEAIDFLHQREEFTDVPRPDTVLLDLNLPKMDGGQVFEEIRSEPDLKQIRVVILTSATEEQSSIELGNPGADAFLTKPADPEEFMTLVRSNVFE